MSYYWIEGIRRYSITQLRKRHDEGDVGNPIPEFSSLSETETRNTLSKRILCKGFSHALRKARHMGVHFEGIRCFLGSWTVRLLPPPRYIRKVNSCPGTCHYKGRAAATVLVLGVLFVAVCFVHVIAPPFIYPQKCTFPTRDEGNHRDGYTWNTCNPVNVPVNSETFPELISTMAWGDVTEEVADIPLVC